MTKKPTFFNSLFVKKYLTSKMVLKLQKFYTNKIKVRVSQWKYQIILSISEGFVNSPFSLALTKTPKSAILTFNQCPQMCYSRTSLVNWIIKLMLKYYSSFFLPFFLSFFLPFIHEEILLHQWLSPQNLPSSPNVSY